MEKKYYVIYLNPCRQDFAQTMTAEEINIMQQHIAYWKTYLDQGVMLLFGPVMDPIETYGMGVVKVDDEAQLVQLIDNDPASKINKYEYYPMRVVTAL